MEIVSLLYIAISTYLALDSTTMFIALCQTILVTGFVFAILLSWLPKSTAIKLGFTHLEQAREQGSAKHHAWQKLPLYPRINHRLLVRALKQRPALRYWYSMSFININARQFVAKANLIVKYKTLFAMLKPAQLENWAASNDGCWKVGFDPRRLDQ